ncbi:MAG: ABC transporter ATP-binding protein [Ruminococcaceae bacterium]|nr:ABC transporter ATP-binding protein [Oscillospiraceae bacterium]
MKKHSSLIWVFKRIKSHVPLMLLLVASNAGSALFGVVFALGTRQVIDSAAAGNTDKFFDACILQALIIAGILVCRFFSRYTSDLLTMELDRNWKRSLLNGLLHAEYSEVSGYHSGELINRLNNDVKTLDDGLVSSIPGIVAMLVRLVSAFLILLSLEPVFALVFFAIGAAAVVCTGLVRRKLKALHKSVSESEGKVLGFLQETLEKLLIVQAMDVTGEAEKRADNLLTDRLVVQRRKRNVSLAANTGVSVLYYGAGFVALVWCAFRLLQGSMSFGSLTAVTQLVGQLQAPFVNLSGVMPKFIAMSAAADRLMELDEITHYPEECINSQDLYTKMTGIEASAVSFSYEDELVLEHASFFIPKGTFIAVTGTSGAGKSTLIKLMLGIFPLDSGDLKIVSENESVCVTRNTRRLFAYVPQGNYLFSGTIRENLMLIRPDATEEELQGAVFVSGMDAFLPQLSDGLDTVLGENGEGISEGQAQRVAIARAVLSEAPILLLDEATSALDAETEEMILDRISKLDNRMCIAVTHRPAVLRFAQYRLDVNNKEVNLFKQ